ncbi:type VI secretion system Vgr family protein [Thauera sinica]|nr:type VI secretion system Vgr family protein [Thauera sp. K11]ATE61631.1 type VI secretion system tip protein VgrG [Thauera sp. K11]
MGLFDAPRTLTAQSAALPQHLGQPALVPVRLSGEEGLSSLFTYLLELKTPDALAFAPSLAANFDLAGMVGREITVSIQLEGRGHFIPGAVGDQGLANQGAGVREISALIAEARYLREEGRHHVYGLTLRPWLWLATLTADCRIFQDKTVIQILDDLFADTPFVVEKRLQTAKYPPRDYQTQFNETDYHFFARLCEEWGIAWWFEHADGKHRLILADQPGAYRPSPSDAYRQVSVYPPGHKLDEEYLHAVSIRDRLVTGAWAGTDVDYTRRRADLAVRHHDPRPTGHADHEVFHWPADTSQPKAGAGGMSGPANDPRAEGGHFARVRLQALRAAGWQASARGNVRGLAAGHTFHLKKHPQDAANIEWLILSARLDIEEIAQESQGSAGIPAQQWRCTVDLELQPTREVYRPPLNHPRPAIGGPVRAIVTGPAGKEIWTDPYGRVKVAFPWDRYHRSDDHSSCWLRVSTAWAGNQYGGIQLPRIGHEVLVSFEGGDPDKPIVTGRVADNQNLPPWQLPGNQALSGLRSKELYGQRNNHLVLDDSEGQIQAQLSSDHALSQLNLGSITRIPDTSGRADRRGEGFELRTDAHGVVRAGAGMLLTTETRSHAASHVKSMGETLARLEAAQEAHAALADLARQHEAQTSGEQDEVSDALERQNQDLRGEGAPNPESGHFPEFAAPHLTLSSPSGIAATSGGSIHLASGEHTALTTGGDLGIASGKGFFASVKEKISLFTQEKGMKFVAAHDDIDVHALKHAINLVAKLGITCTAETIQFQAKKEIIINGGGSYIRLAKDEIEAGTAGKVTVHRAAFSMVGPKSVPVRMPDMPLAVAGPYAARYQIFKNDGRPYEGYRCQAGVDGEMLKHEYTDPDGHIRVIETESPRRVSVEKAVLRESERLTEDWQSRLAGKGG